MNPATQLDRTLIASAKWAFTTRRVCRDDAAGLSIDFSNAKAGDVLLCEIRSIGQHKKIQLANRRLSLSYPGDMVVLVLGDRYAPDQFLAAARITGPVLHLAAGGGIAGEVEAAHDAMSRPTSLSPIGLLTDASGKTLNVKDYALAPQPGNDDITVFGVFGASMNSGKTTATAGLAHGFVRGGYSVAAVKATGTGAFGDFNMFEDAGAPAMDFTDVGMATTYRMPMEDIEAGFDTLIGTAAKGGAEIVVVEFADGVFQPETREILRGSRIKHRLDGVLFAAPDALGAYGGVSMLERFGVTPFAISGMVSCSPLATREAAEVTGLPILTQQQLWDPGLLSGLTAPLMRYSGQLTAA
ncbi:MAG: DUF1611 domain-containing protein [Boseongicola sp.]|nr:MAG: DUF1611 domain-containing protein [Boseongicola sp.]